MYRKAMMAICFAVVVSLAGSGGAAASRDLPTWSTAFDPGPYMLGPYHLIQAVEVFKGSLYTVAGDPQWFGEEERDSAAQIFRSRDGKAWEPASEIGFGLGAVEDICGTNYYDTAWDMQVFEGYLYVTAWDSCWTRPGALMRSADGLTWETVATSDEFVDPLVEDGITWYSQLFKLGVYQGMMYVGYKTYIPEIDWTYSFVSRSPNGDPGTWERVLELPGWYFPASFYEFKGAFYLASDGVVDLEWSEVPDQIWRTFDGVNWEMVADGFGNPGTDSMGAFAAYKDYLYVGDGVYEEGYAGQIWRSLDGLQWEPVVMDGFGNPLDVKVDGLIAYNGYLYAYTVNWDEGGSVFRTKDAVNWERVSEPGWGDPMNAGSHLGSGQAIFKGDLYMGQVGAQGMLVKMEDKGDELK